MSAPVDHIEIKVDETGKGMLLLNGQPLKSLLGIRIDVNAGQLTEVTLRIIASVDADLLAHINHLNTIIYDIGDASARTVKQGEEA